MDRRRPPATSPISRTLSGLIVFAALTSGTATATDSLPSPIVFTQVPRTPAPLSSHESATCPRGSRIVLLGEYDDPTVLTPDFAAACDPSVSFDGRRILFAGRLHMGDRSDIFEMDLENLRFTQLTRNLGDCREPLYLARASVTAPTFENPVRWIAFTSTAAGALDELGQRRARSLYVQNLDPIAERDTVQWRTTYNLGSDFSPTVLADGRVLFSSRQGERVKLMAVTWAGDNLNIFHPADERIVRSMASSWPAEKAVVFVESEPEARGGRLATLPMARPLGQSTVIADGPGPYCTPHALGDGRLLVSHARGAASFRVCVIDPANGYGRTTIFDNPDFDDIDAMPIAPRAEPMARIPMLEFASVLDIEGFESAGQLHCMSIYDSDIEAVRTLEPGSVKWARFIEGIPLGIDGVDPCQVEPDVGSLWPPPCVETRVLGEAPVEADGSFFVNIVGNTPFYIEILDEDKQTLHSMHSWIWVRSKSQRGCIGCHENKELAPQNRATDAIIKMKPTFIGGSKPDGSDATAARMQSSHAPS